MRRPTVLRNSAEPDIVIGIALKIFYQANDWIDNATFLDRLDREYDAINKVRETRNGGQAIAKYKPALYYGLIDVREDGSHRINEFGRKYYEAYVANNEDERVDCLIKSITAHRFGSNNPAVPESRSEIEPPKVYLVSCLLLNNRLSKNEYAYILENLSKDREYQKILVDVSLARLKGSELPISDYAKNNYRDDKGLKFLSDAGFFDDVARGTKSIKQKYIIKYSEVLSSLSVVAENESGNSTKTEPINNFNTNNNVMINKYLAAIRTKPFLLLAGISGTGKSQIVKEMAFATCPNIDDLRANEASPGNYCLIEVKPNWHDSTELLGYDSAIKKRYVVTKFVKFAVKAMRYPEVPFFVCLDEMNLAPVEQYFAEFLSVLESRKIVNGEIISEPLISREAFSNDLVAKELFDLQLPPVGEMQVKSAQLSDADLGDNAGIWDELKEKGLCLPQNLIVIGTVNMDETTHQFSRKVIDRAMTFEMNEADFDSYFEDKVTLDYVAEPLDPNLFLARNVRGNKAIEEIDDLNDQFKTNVADTLKALNLALEDTPFKIAYRVQNELVLYFAELLREQPEANQDELFTEALDDIMMMKVLPRIEGDDELLGTRSNGTLNNLATFAANLPKSSKKIEEMTKRLERSHFTSFWP
ncbi:MAG: hypothetical protein IJ160_06725 [Muribaculaceae bacterium]|nr:hypothetical protein [Muribaculaceae bacterium]